MPDPILHTLGPEGTFSDRAAHQIRERLGTPLTIRYCATLEETVRSAALLADAMAVAPIENSRTGTVAVVQDAILSANVRIVGEMSVSVRFDCVASAPLDRVQRIFVHPVAEAQCLEFLGRQSHAEIVAVRSNADALARLVAAQSNDGPAAAIVPSPAAATHGFLVIPDVQCGDANLTRFLLLKPEAGAPQLDYTLPKTSIVVEPHANRPGLLRAILEPFERRAVNICRLESRPSGDLWSYRFFLDLDGANQELEKALAELTGQGVRVRVLGTYREL